MLTSAPAHTLRVHVVFTTTPRTVAALRRAADLAAGLNASIEVLVPFGTNRDSDRLFWTIVNRQRIESRAHVCRREAILSDLAPHSLVVLGIGKSFLPSREKLLARLLSRAGHNVITVQED